MVFIILGIVTVIIVYLYITTSVHEYTEKKAKEKQKADSSEGVVEDIRDIIKSKKKRLCPICSSEMELNDKLYAEIYKAKPRDKVFIKGCKYCYGMPGKPQSRPDYEGEVAL